jgi:hypothetical protein
VLVAQVAALLRERLDGDCDPTVRLLALHGLASVRWPLSRRS